MIFEVGMLRPTGAWVYLCVAPALAFIAACIDRNYQTDLWHHLARGREIVSTGQLLDRDIFTYTVAGQPFQDPNWLAQVFFYQLYQLGGLPLLQSINAALLAFTIALVVWHCRHKSGSLRLACALGILLFLGMWQLLLIRPQTLSFVIFTLMYLALDAASADRRFLLAPPLLEALWTNVHGAFPLGLVLIGVFLLGHLLDSWWTRGREAFRDPLIWGLALCLAAAFLATLVNPYGWNLYSYVGATSATAAARQIDEWLPPSLRDPIGKVWLASILLTIVAMSLPGRRVTARDLCLLCAFLVLSATASRMVAWWLIVAAPFLAVRLADALPPAWSAETEQDGTPGAGDSVAVGVLALCMVLSLPRLERASPLMWARSWLDARAPASVSRGHRLEFDLEEIATLIHDEQATGRVFCRFDWGEYFGWRLHPDCTVFMDGRIEIIPDAVWEEYEAVSYARVDWGEIVDRYEVTHLVLDVGRHHTLLEQLAKSSTWKRVAQQGRAVLFERRNKKAGANPGS